MGPNIMDEIDCGNFFDQIDDLIEFPPDKECGGGDGNFPSFDDSKDFPSMWNNPLPESDPLFSNDNAASDLSTELSVSYEDIVQLEWLSTFVEDSFTGGGLTIGKENMCMNKEPSPSQSQFQMLSPVSVLESSSSSTSSCLGGKITPVSPSQHATQRARSKRPRPATFNPRAAIQLISSSSSFETAPTGIFSEMENFAESPTLKKIPKPEQKKTKKKMKITFPENEEEIDPNPTNHPVRKCLHCEITKTPQWRAGPMGPKTLCNACGVRYKSGRLYPEYRPAASPTFVPSLHSNSHKKVVEMRNKIGTSTTTNP